MSNSASRQIPEFREDGYLPVGVFRASAEEVIFRFGSPNRKRRQLVLRIRRWIELAKAVGAIKLLVDGSFVTSAESPNDVDAVVWLPLDFAEQLAHTFEPAMELESMLLSRSPEELFGAEDEADWEEWIQFFSRTRELDNRRKGLVEVEL